MADLRLSNDFALPARESRNLKAESGKWLSSPFCFPLVRRGRARGIGVTLVTQRAAVLNKDVLTQVEVLIALRTIAPQDREAIDAWVKVHGTPEQRAELLASLPSLPIGTAWFWSPGWLDAFQRVQ